MSVDEPLTGKIRSIAGSEVDALAFGCWRLTDPDIGRCAELVESAVDVGMNLIDNADVYGLDWGGRGFGSCEEALGEVFRSRPGLRERVVLATKGGIVPGVPYVSDDEYLVSACEASLRRLGVDVVDLYQIHRPDPFTHPARVADTLQSLIDRGLVRAVGVSNYTPSQTRALQAHLDVPLATTQPELSAVALHPIRDGTLDLCTETGVVPLAWSPLAGGRLATGEGVPPALVACLDAIASDHGVTRAVVAVAFVVAHPSSPVAIVGSQNPERLAEIARARDVRLTRAEVYRIIEASDGRPLP
ncbi:MAG: aldo/keto reductase [Actinomycetota bacterium]|nr:aldo/keto reductase [Actinomycetota bacterium]MDA2970976.1 aldo/keto reductase [Actinomycetota bacterium]MDA3001971.1 aldo/keto reductase [Actinomycetota bacterium]